MSENSFAERRQKAREKAGKLQNASEQAGKPLDWFEGLYVAANGDVASVPWADCAPHPGLATWLSEQDGQLDGRAIDIGCGLGDNATTLQKAGFDVTAFDLSSSAVDWAIDRNQGSGVEFQQADLFNLPSQWIGAFDFVHETYTIQSLKGTLRAAAFAEIASLVKPGGRLLVICRSRPEDAPMSGPPWPLARSELKGFEKAGMSEENFKMFEVVKDRIIPHFCVLYKAEELSND